MKGRATLALGAALTAVFAVAALLSLLWTPYPIEVLNVAAKLKAPGAEGYLLGTDHVGIDFFKHRLIQAFLVAVIVVKHAVHGCSPLADALNARTGKTVFGKLFNGSVKHAAFQLFRAFTRNTTTRRPALDYLVCDRRRGLVFFTCTCDGLS